MATVITPRVKEVRVYDGNRAGAYGLLLCKPDLVACVPITPMTPFVEAIWQYVADGRLNAELVEADGWTERIEHYSTDAISRELARAEGREEIIQYYSLRDVCLTISTERRRA